MDTFSVSFEWSPRDTPLLLDEARVQGSSPLWRALDHFVAAYRGRFFVSTARGDVELWFDYDLLHVFDHLPTWLKQVIEHHRIPAILMFPGQGTELKITATRIDHQVTVSVMSLGGRSAFPAGIPSLIVPADRFLYEWRRLLNSVLEALLQFEPALASEQDYLNYRASLDSISTN